MASKGGPDIVENGLTLFLDASNIRSYPGSGTTWSDLSGNGNTGTLTNGPTFSAGNLGSIVFDGTNDYVGSFPTQISGVGSKTICAFIYPTTTSRAGICGTRSVNGDGWVFTINRTTSGNLSYFHTNTVTEIQVAAGIVTNTWTQVCVTYSTTSTTIILYKNGYQVGTSFTTAVPPASSAFNGVIGDEEYTFGVPFKGNMSSVQIYNRALTAVEILQNYNATKSRFGR